MLCAQNRAFPIKPDQGKLRYFSNSKARQTLVAQVCAAFQKMVSSMKRRKAEKSQEEGLPSGRGLTILPNYFADAVWTAGGNKSWRRAATK
jgi:hypothetical protein